MIGTSNVSSLVEKEPELVRVVAKYQVDIVGLTLMHSLGSATSLLELPVVRGGRLGWVL